MSVEPMQLAGEVPQIHMDNLEANAETASDDFKSQLYEWGFMAMEVPGIGAHITELMESFASACESESPSLMDYVSTAVPQISSASNHGFYPFESEVPRLARGVPDPKEFLHVSGAMLEDIPPGSAGVLQAFPSLQAGAEHLFDVGFRLASFFGDLVRSLLPGNPPGLGLSRHSSTLRIIHYINVDARKILAHEHSGIQMLGIQFPPSRGGLQYVLHDGTWVEPNLEGTDIVLCNIGRMLSGVSGGRFRPSTHRVHENSPRPNQERWSTVLFVHPNHELSQWCIENDGSITTLDATWGDFVGRSFRGIGLKT